MAEDGQLTERLRLLEKVPKDAEEHSSLTPLFPVLRGLTSLFVGILGMLICGVVGSLIHPDGGALWGAIIGLVLGLVIGIWATAFWRDIMPSGTPEPHSREFELIITVHETRNVDVAGRMPWMQPQVYMEVSCGSNPKKRTAAKTDGRYNEELLLKITPDVSNIVLKIKDEDVFGSRDVGYVQVNVQRDIIFAGFPWRKGFMIEAGEQDLLRRRTQEAVLILSFEEAEPQCEDMPKPDYGAV